MATAKQVFYNPPLALLPRRKENISSRNTSRHGPTITMAIPFTFSNRMSRLDDRRLKSAASIRRSKTTSLPRLVQPTSARPSVTTRSTTTNSDPVPKRTSSKRTTSGGNASLVSGTEDAVEMVVNDTEVEQQQQTDLSPEEEEEKRLNNEKCRQWLDGLPDKFSGMHVVQHVVHAGTT